MTPESDGNCVRTQRRSNFVPRSVRGKEFRIVVIGVGKYHMPWREPRFVLPGLELSRDILTQDFRPGLSWAAPAELLSGADSYTQSLLALAAATPVLVSVSKLAARSSELTAHRS